MTKNLFRAVTIRSLALLGLFTTVPNAKAESDDPATIETAIPVFEGDITRSYVVIGEVKDNLRKPFAFMANPTKEKILAEIWERAKKMGADAVINARIGETKVTLFNNGRTPISGTAIKYTSGHR